jgi:hypothetical protein
MRTRMRLLVFAALAVLALRAAGASPDPVVLQGDAQRVDAAQLLFLEDPAGTLDAAGAEAALSRGAFQPLASRGGNFGITASTYWLQLRIANRGATSQAMLLVHDYAPTDLVELHLLAGDGTRQRILRGDSVVPEPAAARRRLAVFPLELEAGSSVEALVRIRSSSNLNAELRLWDAQAFEHREGWLTLLYTGCCSGCSAPAYSSCCSPIAARASAGR